MQVEEGTLKAHWLDVLAAQSIQLFLISFKCQVQEATLLHPNFQKVLLTTCSKNRSKIACSWQKLLRTLAQDQQCITVTSKGSAAPHNLSQPNWILAEFSQQTTPKQMLGQVLMKLIRSKTCTINPEQRLEILDCTGLKRRFLDQMNIYNINKWLNLGSILPKETLREPLSETKSGWLKELANQEWPLMIKTQL